MKCKNIRYPLMILIVLLTLVLPVQAQTIRNVELEPESLLPLLAIHPGDPFDRSKVSLSIRNLFQTGLFSDIQVDHGIH